MIKRLLIAIVLLGVVCGGLVYFNMFRNQAIQDFFATMQQPAMPVSVETVESSTWQPGIWAIGTARSARGVELALEAAGVVRDVNFTSNDVVAEGDLLVQIDDAIEQADLVAARSAVALSEQTLERAETLRTRGVSAAASLEEAQANAQSARSQVVRLEAVLRQKSLSAPFGGTIGIPQVEAGQYVTPGTVVATLHDLDTMGVDFSVPEQQRGALDIGQTIALGSENGELRYSGRIIGIEPRIDPATRLVAVRAEVENTDAGLYPGQFVRVRVDLPEEDDIIALPQTAIIASLYGDFVYAVVPAESDGSAAGDASDEDNAQPMQARQIFVQTGRRNGGLIEVREGLSEGDIVVIAGQNRLSNGAAVTISENADTPEDIATEQVRR